MPSIGTSVALYEINIYKNDVQNQQIIDGYDSAAYALDEKSGPGIVIGDHRIQRFKNITRFRPGHTIYIEEADGTRQYFKCVSVDRNGRNVDSSLLDSNGQDSWDFDGLTLYACNDWDGVNVTLAKFKPL